MFTGIIIAIGEIAALTPQGGDLRLTIATGTLPLDEVALGDSIAVSGVCLTAVALGPQQFSADVSRETLSRTTLAAARVGTPVNLELALQPTSRLGGHFVSGHVDGIGRVIAKHNDGRSQRFTIKAPDELARYIAEKGSIAVDGISLTVNRVQGAQFEVNIVPHTLRATTLGMTEVGASVNLEVDLLARYLERLMQGQQACQPSGVSETLLRQSGFLD